MNFTNKQVDNRIRKLIELETEKARIQEAIDYIKNALKEDMDDTETVETANFTVRYTFVKSNRFDSKAFQAEHPALYKKFTKETETRRFSYKAS